MALWLRRLAVSPAVILVVAFLARAGYAWDYQHERPRRALALLPFLFEPGNIAGSLATGKGFSSPLGGDADTGPTAWMAPIYPLILAGIFHILGVRTFASFVAAAVLNILFSSLTVLPIYAVGRRIGGAGVAAIAAWLWTVFPNAVKLPVESLWDASLAALLGALLLQTTLALPDSREMWDWYGYGLLWGVALLTSPSLGVLLPPFVLWLGWRSRRVLWPGLAVAATLLCCLPWMVRNYKVFHAFVPLRSVMGLAFWLGTYDQSIAPWPGVYHPIDRAQERARYEELGEIPYMREKQRQTLEFIVGHPAAELRAVRSHFVALWAGGSSHPLADFWRGGWSFRAILLFNLLGTAGALAGAVILLRQGNAYAFPLGICPVLFPLAYYFALGSPRYRLPMDPFLLLLTAVAVRKIYRAATTSAPMNTNWRSARTGNRVAGLPPIVRL
jgi:4-amino-4-deoxy-L-arabinose transferase-like glycosyltransferase